MTIQITSSGKYAPRLKSRVFNWKFLQACQYLQGQPRAVKKLVRALATRYENPGWLDDTDTDADLAEANMSKEEAIMVSAIVDMLLGSLP